LGHSGHTESQARFDHFEQPGRLKPHRLTFQGTIDCLYAKIILTVDKNKRKLRLSNDNRSVANAVIHFPRQKLLTFCSVFTDLLSPQNFSQALNAAREVPAIRTEW